MVRIINLLVLCLRVDKSMYFVQKLVIFSLLPVWEIQDRTLPVDDYTHFSKMLVIIQTHNYSGKTRLDFGIFGDLTTLEPLVGSVTFIELFQSENSIREKMLQKQRVRTEENCSALLCFKMNDSNVKK